MIFGLGAILGGAAGYVLGYGSSPRSAAKSTSTPVAPASQFYTVTGVSGTTIEVVKPDGTPLLVFTTPATTYAREGLNASLSDIKPGMLIAVKGKTGTGYQRIAARILIEDVFIFGTVQSILNNKITLSGSGGNTITVSLNPGAHVLNASTHQAISQSTLHTGVQVHAYGEILASGDFSADVLLVSP
jgi:hypothetical protein